MTTIGSIEANAHLAQLLERASAGERILITNEGKPVAMLVPPEIVPERSSKDVGQEMLAYRDKVKRKLGGSARNIAHDEHKY